MEWVVIGLIAIVVVALGLYLFRRRRPRVRLVVPTPVPGPVPGAEEPDRYRELLRMVQGNRATADRLIDYERVRAPGESRREWVTNAIERMRRDQR